MLVKTFLCASVSFISSSGLCDGEIPRSRSSAVSLSVIVDPSILLVLKVNVIAKRSFSFFSSDSGMFLFSFINCALIMSNLLNHVSW